MDQNLKTQLVHAIFQLKSMQGAGLGMDSAHKKSVLNMTELTLMKGIAENSTDSDNNVALPDIRGYLSISKAAVSQTLGVLEKKGYINRDIDKNNRRNLIVTLTPEGREVLTDMNNAFSSRLDQIIAHLGEEDVKHMIATIQRMTEVIYKLNSEEQEESE